MANFTFPTGNINGNPSPARNVFLLAAANDVSKSGSILVSDVLGQLTAADVTNVLTYGTVTTLSSSDTIQVLQSSTRSKIALSDFTNILFLGAPTDFTSGFSPTAAHNNHILTYTSSSGGACTLGNLAVGVEFTVIQRGTGAVTFTAGSGMSIVCPTGTASPVSNAQNGGASCVQLSSSVWWVQGSTT